MRFKDKNKGGDRRVAGGCAPGAATERIVLPLPSSRSWVTGPPISPPCLSAPIVHRWARSRLRGPERRHAAARFLLLARHQRRCGRAVHVEVAHRLIEEAVRKRPLYEVAAEEKEGQAFVHVAPRKRGEREGVLPARRPLMWP
eukprot:scaffold6967_cov123-Isochrysis_galbana.AAC.12